ncbi:MAG: bifunctional demethylmenaquinone methyltransferase/2-methoxy-6-polyprenyl-1,4-benzoquinol methylase UbiE [Paludibacteraceae bacterium]|nr:bifunctional demethylmenaquinone methyltransferase/2-methoxy-6-polyprenyl-1,4-benzoquinol methylase UbiE [Paludibacteraceae bacterium]MBN2786851.1 bifunctional demethylmenaquinone methyltransferase/2-methoxy-6-polyprenyl-1,4-benzoquinol methylase UbiE [Paludibacteraceae bacterium]
MSDKGYKVEKVLPYKKKKEGKEEQVKEMFNSISTHYDAMNRAMTMGIDVTWRRRAIKSLRKYKPKLILDVATGTADFAIEASQRLRPLKIIGIDISEKMIENGRIKVAKQGLSNVIELKKDNCLQCSYDEALFDAVTVAFGLRNFENLEKGIKEMYRVLKPGGNLVILELSEPSFLFLPFYRIYTKLIIPFMACSLRQDVKAYQYLPTTIQYFPKGKEMIALLQKCGFKEVKYRRFTFGVCSFYRALK